MARHILITGPTTTGKTRLAAMTAEAAHAHLVNSDKFHLFQDFQLGIGISPNDYPSSIPRHLYAILKPSDDVLSLQSYLSQYRKVLGMLKDAIVIVEGGSFSYNQALIDKELVEAYCLLWDDDDWIFKKLKQRIAELFNDGVVEETASFLAQSLDTSYVMTKGLLYRGIISHLEGRCSLDAAREEIVISIFRAARYQKSRYSQLNGVTFLSVERGHAEALPVVMRTL